MKKIFLTVMVIVLCAVFAVPIIAAPKWPIPDGTKTVEVNDYYMAYREAGNGIPLVLVHGALTDYRTWNAQVPDFSKSYRTISVSLRHYYPEKWNGIGEDFSILQHASDVAAFIKELNLGKVHLLGHSRGGAVVLHVARLYPGIIRTLILEDASGMEWLLPSSEGKKPGEGTELTKTLRANIAAGDMEKAAREFMDSLSGAGAWEKLPAETKQAVLDNIATGMGSGERPKISCAEIQNFKFPVLLLSGERSPKRYGEMIAAMRQCNPEIQPPVIVPKAAHTMHGAALGNPEFFNNAVLHFLKQH